MKNTNHKTIEDIIQETSKGGLLNRIYVKIKKLLSRKTDKIFNNNKVQ